MFSYRGVDSTLLAKVVADEFKKMNRQLNGYSMTNHDAPNFDETKWIEHAVKANQINNVEVDMNFEHFIGAVEHGIYAFERPIYAVSPAGIYLFSKRASEDVTVLTSGDGADEIGGGYPAWFGRYYAYAAEGKELQEEFDSVNGGIKFIEYFD